MSGKMMLSRLICDNDSMSPTGWKIFASEVIYYVGFAGLVCSLGYGAYYGLQAWLITTVCTVLSIIAMVCGSCLSRRLRA